MTLEEFHAEASEILNCTATVGMRGTKDYPPIPIYFAQGFVHTYTGKTPQECLDQLASEHPKKT